MTLPRLQTAYAARDFMGRNKSEETPNLEDGAFMKEVVMLLCRLHLNAFTLTDDDLRPVGMGLYPVAALLNHDCAPNCVPTMHGTTLHVRASRDIRAGEELRVSYVDEAEERQARRAQLLERYLFNCSCNRCEKVLEDAPGALLSATPRERAQERVLDRSAPLPSYGNSAIAYAVPGTDTDRGTARVKMGLKCPRPPCPGPYPLRRSYGCPLLS
eukprot:1628151-Rhodomonas_salina.2